MLQNKEPKYDKRKFKIVNCKNKQCKNKIIKKRGNLYPYYCKNCQKNYHKIYNYKNK